MTPTLPAQLPDATPPEPISKPADPFSGGLFGGLNLQQPVAQLGTEGGQPAFFTQGPADISVSSIHNVSKHSMEEPPTVETRVGPPAEAPQDKGGFFFLQNTSPSQPGG